MMHAARCRWPIVLALALVPSVPVATSPAEPAPAPIAPDRTILDDLRDGWRLRASGALAESKAAFGRVTGRADAPAHDRREAEEAIREIERLEAGQPARDPAASRRPPPSFPRPGAELHVAPDGDDAGPGTAERPFATFERARDAIRALRKAGGLPSGGVSVEVRGGDYRRTATFRLGSEDSGGEGSPIVWRAAAGTTPRLRGGIRLRGFEPVRDPAILERLPPEARGSVVRCDLRALGIERVPPLRLGGFTSGAGFRTWPVVECFFDGRALTLARFPNEGHLRVGELRGKETFTVWGSIQGNRDGRFAWDGDRPARWVAEKDPWLHGYWFWDWADSYERVERIDPAARELVLAPPYSGYGYRKGQRYFALNLLSEIDLPGEWYLDRDAGAVYLWPPSAPEASEVELSLLESPLVEIDGASRVALVGLTFELGAADGIVIAGGERCLVAGCTVRRCGGDGIVVRGGSGHGVLSCDVHSLGRGGTRLAGGDRKTLTPGGHFIENCHVHDLSRIDRTYTPAVLLEGVGNRVARNLMHGVASSAMRIEGNDHTIEGNEVFDVLLESDDQGGADMFGNPTYRGNVFRCNYWHHVGGWERTGEEPSCGRAGIRLDDAISGVLISGNIFYKASGGALGFGGVQIHGGKENRVDNNLFVECRAAISFSPWGDGRWRQFTEKSLDAREIDRALYLSRWPELSRLAEDHDRNRITRNLALRCEKFLLREPGRNELEANEESRDEPGLPGAARGDFTQADGGKALAARGFRPIPFEEIGLYVDAFRRELPEELVRAARAR